MTRRKIVLLAAADLSIFIAIVLLMAGCMGYLSDGPFSDTVESLDVVSASVDGGAFQTVELPYSFDDLAPRTPVVVTAHPKVCEGDSVYIKSVYAPAKIFADGQLIYEFGKRENYPSFMRDPATEVHIIELNPVSDTIELRMEFLSPASRRSLMVHPPLIGGAKNLIFNLFLKLGPPLIFSFLEILYGLALMFIAACILFVDRKGLSFLWLGLMALLAGAWSFGENNFTALIIKNPTFLYLTSFIGLFTFILPLLHFIRSVIDFKNPKPLWYMEWLLALSAAAALILQWTGAVSCSSSMYFFHAVLPLVLLACTALTAAEFFRFKNTAAGRFIPPVLTLTVAGLLEIANYKFMIEYAFSSLFQIGILAFFLLMGITAGLAVKDSIDLKKKQEKLLFEKNMMDIQIKEQQSRSLLLSRHEALLRRQRHDLRHHLEAIKELAREENSELQSYLQTLTDNLPKPAKTFCENPAVNSIISHYDALCTQENIRLSLHIAVPEALEHINASSLCVVFGNLLENAVEACRRMTEGDRFIQLNTSLQYDLLTITMDNSFNGCANADGNRFRSSKREGFGIGLDSIRSVAQKSGGDAEFTVDGGVFLSSVYLKI